MIYIYIYICTSSKYSSNYVDVYKYVICCFTKHSSVGLPTLNWRAWPVEPGRHRPCTLQWKEVRSVRNFGNSIRITLVECDGSARSAHFTVLHTSTYMLLVVEFLQIAIFQPHLLQEWIKRWRDTGRGHMRQTYAVRAVQAARVGMESWYRV